MRGAVRDHRQRSRGWGWRRRLAPPVVALVLALLGCQLVGLSQAAANTGKGCPPTSRAASTSPKLPGVDASLAASAMPSPVNYRYNNPAESLRGLPQPDEDTLELVGNDPSAPGLSAQERALAAWNRYSERKETQLRSYEEQPRGRRPSAPLPWSKWLNNYIPNQGNAARGRAYEALVARAAGNTGWECQQEAQGAPGRIYDALDRGNKIAYEFKSGARVDKEQLAKDKAFAAKSGYTMTYVFGTQPSAATMRALAHPNIRVRVLAAVGVADPTEQVAGTQQPAAASDPLRAPGQGASSGAAGNVTAGSPDTPAQAAELAAANEANAADSGAADQAAELGGIDFSTLELRYVSDTDSVDGSGLQYAFQAKATADGQVSFGGEQAAQQASDAFFVWLALPPSSFTVNLDPAEPNRIIDAQLGRTDAGRVLLEADLQMKKTTAALIHPNTALGLRFWNSLRGGADGSSCLSFRAWIVPTPATVHESKGELHILDAPLAVKMESEYAQGSGLGGATKGCAAPNSSTQRHNEAIFRALILPNITKAVNTAPAYADLRRVYLSRVAAQWMLERSEKKTTAYSKVIGSRNIDRWVSRQPWSPREVFNRFVKSYTKGEFNVTRKTREGNIITTTTYIYGGVDFTGVPRVRLTPGAFQKQWSALPATLDKSLRAPTPDQNGRVWLGAEVPADPHSTRAKSRRLLRSGIRTVEITAAVSAISVLVTLTFVPYLVRRRRRIAT